MDPSIQIETNALIVESNGIEYILTGLNEDKINELKRDAKQLTTYFQHCLINGLNICLHKQPTTIDVPVPSTHRLAQNRSQVKRSAIPAPVNKMPSILDDADAGPSNVKKPKRNAKLTEDEQNLFDELLTTQVMVQPMLHNPKLKSNKFAGMKAEKWKQICDTLHEDVPNADTTMSKVKERWEHIRDGYLKRLRLQKQGSGSGFLEVDDGPLDELLSGLKDIYELKENSSNIAEPEKSSKVLTSINATSNIASNKKIQEKKIEEGTMKIIEESSEIFLSAIENIKDSFVTKKEETQGQDKATKFCDFLLLELRDLDDKNFRKAQIQILQVVSDLKDQN